MTRASELVASYLFRKLASSNQGLAEVQQGLLLAFAHGLKPVV